MIEIEAVVFDFDGLIRDTEWYEYQSFCTLLQEYNVELPLDLYCSRVGDYNGGFDPYQYLQKCVSKSLDLEMLRIRRRAVYSELVPDRLTRPGVMEYLNRAKQLGLPVGLASSSPRNWILTNLQELGITSYFDCIRGNEDVACVKPDPELYQLVTTTLRVSPERAIAFEDSPAGAAAALAAGMYCVIVPNALTCHLSFPGCHLRLTTMTDLTLDEVIAQLPETP
ncbi:HAD family hydrolase [Paenibacillus daejeonensis]|uniref:HAD family hydrolase n=1 Tax=Paenibacillus daejeonensis TaxID=135193 RepID=UPI000374A59A|nr:HAD-IA family hydrolase [Paenibacillus daejeonensis]